MNQVIYVSATPAEYERGRADQIVEQVIRPTGLLDPRVEVRPVEGQIDDLIGEINARSARRERVLVTTLTKKMAEDLTVYLTQAGIKVRYMHHDVETIERMELIRDLRLGEFDVLVGINLLREGLDMPEVSLVAILDADKEGFLRSETSLIQTIGRAARNADGMVILYADTITPSMRRAMDETERRREKQDAFNKAHGIVPKTVIKSVREVLEISKAEGGQRPDPPPQEALRPGAGGGDRQAGEADEGGQQDAGIRVRGHPPGPDQSSCGRRAENRDRLWFVRTAGVWPHFLGKKETVYVGCICPALGGVRRPHIHPGEDRHRRGPLQSGHRHPHGGGAGHGLGDRGAHRQERRASATSPAAAGCSWCLSGAGHGPVLAVLLLRALQLGEASKVVPGGQVQRGDLPGAGLCGAPREGGRQERCVGGALLITAGTFVMIL